MQLKKLLENIDIIGLVLFIAFFLTIFKLYEEKYNTPVRFDLLFSNFENNYAKSIPRQDIEINYDINGDLIIKFKNNNYRYMAFYLDNVQGASMSPVLGKGNLLIRAILNNKTEKINLYDIVEIKQKEPYVLLHQIVGFCNNNGVDGFVTKGTNNFIVDYFCWDKKNVEYKTVGVIWTK